MNKKILQKRLCSVEGCDRGHFGLNFCKMHYRRFKKYGFTGMVGTEQNLYSLSRPNDLKKFFLSNIRISKEGCYEWIGKKNNDGYGTLTIDKKTSSVHRYMAALSLGFDIKSELCVLHKCDNPCCINPEHLFIGTQEENIQDMVRKKRIRVGSSKPLSKLNEDSVKKIKELLLAGMFQYEIAKMFNIDRTIISRINTGEAWKHVL